MAKKPADPRSDTQATFPGWDVFAEQVGRVVDPCKLEKASQMLRSGRFRLFADVQPDHALGIVRSQGSSQRVYSCRLGSDGSYACCTQNLITRVVSRDSPCKHLLVLIIGLARAGELDPDLAIDWLGAARRPRAAAPIDNSPMAETFLRYKGVEAGEVDWRPTETIPEDFYAL